MKLTIGRGKNAQSLEFATGKGWKTADTHTLLKVMKNAAGFIPSAATKQHKARARMADHLSAGRAYVAQ